MEIQAIGNEAANFELTQNHPAFVESKHRVVIGRDSVELSLFQERDSTRRFKGQDSLDISSHRLFDIDADSELFSPDATQIQFTRDSESGRFAIAVIDSATKEVLREIPPQEVLDVLSKLSQSREHVFQLLS